MRVRFRQNLTTWVREICREEEALSVEQIVAVLKQAEVGVPVAELIRQVGISEHTLYRCKKQYKGWKSTTAGSSSSCKMRMRG
jgi:DNA invertase Pin-like site-specific DNA recombinase